MVPLGAEILTEVVAGDDRGAVRRTLRLGVQTHVAGEVAMALILNMSETGLLLETVVELGVGEIIHVDIAGANATAVRVVWTDGLLAGCAFFNPVSTGVVSAARLKAPAGSDDAAPTSPTRPDRRWRAGDRDETGFEKTLVMISALIAVVALMLFFAAVWPL